MDWREEVVCFFFLYVLVGFRKTTWVAWVDIFQSLRPSPPEYDLPSFELTHDFGVLTSYDFVQHFFEAMDEVSAAFGKGLRVSWGRRRVGRGLFRIRTYRL